MAGETAHFTIYGRLDGLNEYTRACRTNRFAGAKLKNKNEALVKQAASGLEVRNVKFLKKVHITYRWHEQNKRRDLDNIAFAKKFIQDALVEMGVLDGDGWKNISGFTDEFYVDKDNPRVEVVIMEV